MDKKQFSKLFHDHADALYRFAYWRVSDTAQAEDIVSSVFTKAWEHRDSFDGKNAQAWLYRIARNTIIDNYRKTKTVELNDEMVEDESEKIEAEVDKKLEAAKLRKALSKLDDQSREIVHWRFIERKSAKEVGDRMGLSAENVRIIQFRALKRLKKYYES